MPINVINNHIFLIIFNNLNKNNLFNQMVDLYESNNLI